MRTNKLAICLAATLAASTAMGQNISITNGRLFDNIKQRVIPGRSVQYFQPSAMHHEFWFNLEEQRIDADFELFKERGFDTIILKPDWGAFVSEIHHFDKPNVTDILNATTISRLNLLLTKAQEYDLYVVFMAGHMNPPQFFTDAGQTEATRIIDHWLYRVKLWAPEAPYENALFMK